jgi:hypothetical protein
MNPAIDAEKRSMSVDHWPIWPALADVEEHTARQRRSSGEAAECIVRTGTFRLTRTRAI